MVGWAKAVFDAKQKLSRSLPALVAFKGIFRVKGADHVANLNGASQNVEAVVCRPHQFDVFNFGPGTAPCQLKQIGFVAIQELVPSQVGAAVTNGHVSQNA